jgi:hypothetical protein
MAVPTVFCWVVMSALRKAVERAVPKADWKDLKWVVEKADWWAVMLAVLLAASSAD